VLELGYNVLIYFGWWLNCFNDLDILSVFVKIFTRASVVLFVCLFMVIGIGELLYCYFGILLRMFEICIFVWTLRSNIFGFINCIVWYMIGLLLL